MTSFASSFNLDWSSREQKQQNLGAAINLRLSQYYNRKYLIALIYDYAEIMLEIMISWLKIFYVINLRLHQRCWIFRS